MRATTIALLVGIAAGFGFAHAEEERPPIRMELVPPQPSGGPASVLMEVTQGLPVIDVMMNGRGPFKFAVDTGASGQVHVSAALQVKLGLVQVGEARAADGSGQNVRHVPLVAIDGIAIGNAVFHKVTGAVTSPRNGVIDGVIGMGLLRDYLLTLNYPRKAFMLEQGALPPADGKHVFDYQPGRSIIIPVKVGDVEIPTHLDTGNARHPFIVAADLVPRLATRGEPRAIGQAHTISNTVDMFAVNVTAPVRVGDVTLPIKEISYPTVAPGGNLGTLALLGVVLRVDQKNHRVSLTTP